jgi:hypothetical protein
MLVSRCPSDLPVYKRYLRLVVKGILGFTKSFSKDINIQWAKALKKNKKLILKN